MPAGVVALSTMRGDWTPEEPYSGFNTCHYTGDTPEHVAHCRAELCAALGCTSDRLVIPTQTHSANVGIIDSLPVGELSDTDAVVTTLPGVALVIHTADCVPLVLADTTAGVIAAVHAGWRGAVAGIAGKTVAVMESLGAKASEIDAAMGPCICAGCFEVGEEVAAHFNQGDIIRREGCKPHVDLPAAVKRDLVNAGLRGENIRMPQSCSRCDHGRFFSARRLGVKSGRTATAIILQEEGGAQRRR